MRPGPKFERAAIDRELAAGGGPRSSSGRAACGPALTLLCPDLAPSNLAVRESSCVADTRALALRAPRARWHPAYGAEIWQDLARRHG